MLLNETSKGSEPQDKVSTGLYRGVWKFCPVALSKVLMTLSVVLEFWLTPHCFSSLRFLDILCTTILKSFRHVSHLVLRCGISHGKPCLTLALIYRGIHDWVNDCKVTRSCDRKTRPNHPPLCLQLVWGLCSAMLHLDFHQIWWRALWPNIYTFMLSLQRTLFQKISLDGTF